MTTETTDRENDKDRLADDPPIIVGGGGSTYVWLRNDLTWQLLPNPANPPYEFEDFDFRKENYKCYHLPTVRLRKYKTHDGEDEGGSHSVKVRGKHGTRFYEN